MTGISAFTVSTAAGQPTPPCLVCGHPTEKVTEYADGKRVEVHYEPCGHREWVGGTPLLEMWLLLAAINGGD